MFDKKKKKTKSVECVKIEIPHIDRMKAINNLSSAIEKVASALITPTNITIQDSHFSCTEHPGIEVGYEKRETKEIIILGEENN